MKVPFLDLAAQYHTLKAPLDWAVAEVLDEAAFVGGHRVAFFEREFAQYLRVSHCVGVGNGTDAIEIALEALALPHGSEIIVPANTFIATAEAVTRAGHCVVFADVDETYTLDPNDVRRRVTERTAALLPVHLYGQPCDMVALNQVAAEHSLALVEDCAQAHGAEFAGRKVGSFGSVAAFSFYPGKILGAFGDGGAITTDDSGVSELCRKIANHGRTSKYEHEFEGRNSRLDGLQAAVLRVKLAHLDLWVARRREVAAIYDEGLADVAWLTRPAVRPDRLHAFHLYVVRVPQRDALAKHLRECSVQTGVHYPVALPKLAAYRHLRQSATPNAMSWDDELLSLPMGEHLTDQQVHHVIDSVRCYMP